MLTTSRTLEVPESLNVRQLAPEVTAVAAVARPVTRSPAQVEASRINGAKSRGPRTPEGREIASRNAIKHGLLSRRIAPVEDFRGEHLDYEQQLQGLIDEYRPQTRTEMNLVETLARDFVVSGRIALYSELVMTPDPEPRGTQPSAEPGELDGCEQRRAVAATLLERLGSDLSFALTVGELEECFGLMTRTIASVRENARYQRTRFRQPKDSGLADDARLWRRLRFLGRRPEEAGTVRDVLADRRTIEPSERPGWQLLLERVLEHAEWELRRCRNRLKEHEEMCRRAQRPLLGKLPQMLDLDAYDTRNRRKIERTIGMLLELRRRRG